MAYKNSSSKIFVAILTCLLVGVLVFGVVWVSTNAGKLKDAVNGTNLYTQEDLQKAKQDGYNEALQNEQDYLDIIAGLRDDKTTLTDNLAQANSRITLLSQDNTEKQATITQLQSTISSNNAEITRLNGVVADNNSQIATLTTQRDNLSNDLNASNVEIADLNSTILSLQNANASANAQITELQGTNISLQVQINSLNSTIIRNNEQINALTNLVNSLQNENDSNIVTIARLNDRISLLQNQINVLNASAINNTNNYDSLNATITELQAVISYYKSYIDTLKPANTVVATFMYNNSVYNIQCVQPNAIVNVQTPTSTNYVIFNYWTVNGQQVDLTSYQVTQNTDFIADVTYKYDVVFKVDNAVYDTQLVVKNNNATLPTAPTKSGYTFNGWLLNGVLVDVTTLPITSNIELVADFLQQHNVAFVAEDNTSLSTEVVQHNNYIVNIPTSPTKTGYTFLGWTINGTDVVDVVTYKVVADVTFSPLFEINVYTVTFKQDNTVLGTKQVEYNNVIGTVNYNPVVPQYYEHQGWVIKGIWTDTDVNLNTYLVTSNLTLTAKLVQVQFTISFYGPNDTLLRSVITNTSGRITVNDIPTAPTVTNYVFTGWATSSWQVGNIPYTNSDIAGLTYRSNRYINALYRVKYAGYFVCEDINEGFIVQSDGKFGGSVSDRNQYSIRNYFSDLTSVNGLSNEVINNDNWSYSYVKDGSTIKRTYTLTYNVLTDSYTYYESAYRYDTNSMWYEITRVFTRGVDVDNRYAPGLII